MPSYSIDVRASGPVFDGRGGVTGEEFINRATLRLAETGRDWIRIEAESFDRSGRGGTGRAAEGVLIQDRGYGRAIWGSMIEGQVWWPWLEGKSKRNHSTKFKGYKTFKHTEKKLKDYLQEILRPLIDDYVAKMGGR